MGEYEPVVVVFTKRHGRYRVEFSYAPAALAVLKKTVPVPMRRFAARLNPETEHWEPLPGEDSKFWEVSIDWVGPLASAFVNAGIEVLGLNQANIGDWFGVFSAAVPTSSGGHRAYVKGFCKTCEAVPYRPGGAECEDCHCKRLIAQHRVKAVLAEARAVPYPEALPATGSARTTRAPLEIDRSDVAIIAHRDHGAVLDILIEAEHDRSAICPICGRRPPRGAAVHVACRTRLLHALDDGRPFSKARNAAFQDGLCTVCRARPHRLPGDIACAHCAELIDVCQSLRWVCTDTITV
jgi:hypothetical protein